MSDLKTRIIEFMDRSEDFPTEPVPQNKRKPWYSIAMVWTGIYISIASILDGLAVISGLSFKRSVIVLIVAFFTFLALTALQGSIGTETGLSTYMISKQSFGKKGSHVVSLISLIVNVGWFAINVRALAESVHAIWFGNIQVMCIVFGILMIVTATIGYKGIEALSMPTVIYTFGFMLFNAVIVIRQDGIGFIELINRAPIGEPVHMSVIISVLVGAMAAGAVNAPDVMRFSRKTSDNFKGLYLIGLPLAICQPLCAIILALHVQSGEFATVMVEIGGIAGLLMVILGSWTSNDNALYSASLAFTEMFPKLKRWMVAITLGIIASFVAAFINIGLYSNIMLAFGCFIVPVLGIMISDYFVLPKVGLDSGISLIKGEIINPIAIIVWFLGGVYAFLLDFQIVVTIITLPSVVKNMLICSVVYALLMKVRHGKVVKEEV
ncbi:MAG: cytosine permease [Peptoniphilus lacydonensis]|uniref:purine-cytosine permease family protein n=1 Tax=Peptoniphilus lacydonensis TaxID=1673725 RepID=UPI0028FDF6AB|nr:cytosine permease [Peptoniphilus lacydonensis]MDU1954854.1 cytosine permease [Peptoniphilus lacydonensis]MDU5274339.1 cytosine permease [Peptoniphilus lacydonensis]